MTHTRSKLKMRARKSAGGPPATTQNGKLIRGFMSKEHVRGNHRDYVIVVGARVIDWQGSFDIIRESDGEAAGVDAVALFHKKDLWRLIGKEQAARFWHHAIGKRVLEAAPPVLTRVEG